MARAAVVIPTKNESGTIAEVIGDVRRGFAGTRYDEIVVIVADDSSDDTRAIASRHGAVIVRGMGEGLGVAMLRGLKAALQFKPDVIVSVDGDGQADASTEIRRFLEPIDADRADMVLGSRFLGDNLVQYDYRFINRTGTRILSAMLRFQTGLKLTDSHGGIRAMRPEVVADLEILGTQTYVQESIIDAVEKGYRILEISSVWKHRVHGKSRVVSSIPKYVFYTLPILILRSGQHIRWLYSAGIVSVLAGFAIFFIILLQEGFTYKLGHRLPAILLVALCIITGPQLFFFGFVLQLLKQIKRNVDRGIADIQLSLLSKSEETRQPRRATRADVQAMQAVTAPLNIAVIGFGKLGLLHAGLANALDGCRLSAVVDTSATVLGAIKSYLGDVRVYDDYRKLLADGGIDAAIIATPTGLHVPIAVECVKAGVPILIEKPLSLTVAQAEPLVAALRMRPVVNMVGYMGRHIDTFAKAKEIVASGALGRLQMLRSSMYIGQLWRAGKGWRYEKETSGGGVLITQNAHLVDKLLWMFGEVTAVSGQTRRLYSKEVEDYCHAFFSFRSGLTGYMDSSWSARHFRTPTISIHVQSEGGTLDVDDDQVRLFLDKPSGAFPLGWSVWRKPDLYRGVTVDIGGPQYTLQMEEFVHAVRAGGSVGSDVASACRTQQVIDAIYRSADQAGAPIALGAGAA